MKKAVYTLFVISFVACNLFKPASITIYQQNDDLDAFWEILSQNWKMENGMLQGEGENMNWGVLLSRDSLPSNYEIELDVNMVAGSLFELMLNIDGDKYVRAYLYEIEQNVNFGRGEFSYSAEGRPGGGITVKSAAVEILNNTWYHIKIKSLNNRLVLKINDNKLLELSIIEEKLSTKGRLGLLTNGQALIKNLTIKSLR